MIDFILDDTFVGSPLEIKKQKELKKCSFCNKEYFSRGANDPGFCRECEEKGVPEQASSIIDPTSGILLVR